MLATQLATFHRGWKPSDDNLFQGNCKFLPMEWFKDVLVLGTSKNLEDANEPPPNLGEILCWLNLKGLIATNVGFP